MLLTLASTAVMENLLCLILKATNSIIATKLLVMATVSLFIMSPTLFILSPFRQSFDPIHFFLILFTLAVLYC